MSRPIFGIYLVRLGLTILLLAVPAALGFAAPAPRSVAEVPAPAFPEVASPGHWVVQLPVVEPAAVAELADWADLWGVLPEKGVSIFQVDALGLERLRDEGHAVEVDLARSKELHRLGQLAKGQTGGIPGFPCYRTVEETFATAEAMVAAHPDLASWIDIGDSWVKTQVPSDGYDLMLLRLTQKALPGPKPKLFVSTAVHAREYATAELAIRFAENLLAGYGVDADATWILDHHEIHLLLHGNPDGRKRAETGLSWRKNANNGYCGNTNDRGADLNRNYDFQWGCCGGSSSSQCSTIFRGPSPSSEPETQAIQDYLRLLFPDQRPPDLSTPAPDSATGLAVDIHSFGQDVLWSWGFTTTQPPAPNGAQLYTLGRKYAYFTEYRPQHGSLSTVDGGGKDFAYGELGVPGYVIELGTTFFQSCEVFESAILPGNLPALLYLAKVPRTPYQTPAGPEVLGISLPPRAFLPGEKVPLTATLDDGRFSNANGIEPVESIASGQILIDQPPWSARGGGLPLAPVDGSFDATVEAAMAEVDTTGLAPGRHTLYLTAEDSAGNVGPVSAAFLQVLDPLSAPALSGTVRDGRTGLPLAARVLVGGFVTDSDPVSAAYSLRVPPGGFALGASADGYVAGAPVEVTLAAGQTLRRDISLVPAEVVLVEDAETGPGGWTAQAPWAITTEAAFSPTHSWADSPGGNYANGVNVSLTSPLLDLSQVEGVSLELRQLRAFERAFDFGRVEASTDGGGTWQVVATVTGIDPDNLWERLDVALPQLDGAANARIRFRVDADGGLTADGWHLDDIRLGGVAIGQTGIIFGDGFETGDLSAWAP